MQHHHAHAGCRTGEPHVTMIHPWVVQPLELLVEVVPFGRSPFEKKYRQEKRRAY